MVCSWPVNAGTDLQWCTCNPTDLITEYRMVVNLRGGFIFAYFASQEPFTKIKPWILLVLTCTRRVNCGTTSNSLSVLTPTDGCQRVCLWRLLLKAFRKSKFYVGTDKRTKGRCRTESGSNRFYERPEYEAALYISLAVTAYLPPHTGTMSSVDNSWLALSF